MLHNLIAEFLSTGLMILFGVGVHCDEVLTNHKISTESGHIFAITTWAFGISVCLYIFWWRMHESCHGTCTMCFRHASMDKLYSIRYCRIFRRTC